MAGLCECSNGPLDYVNAMGFLTSWVTVSFMQLVLTAAVSVVIRNG